MALWGSWIWTTWVFWSLSLFPCHASCRRSVKATCIPLCFPVWMYRQGWMDPGILCQKSSYLVCVNIFLLGWCSYISTLRYGCFVIPIPWTIEFLVGKIKIEQSFTDGSPIIRHYIRSSTCFDGSMVSLPGYGTRALSQEDRVIRWGWRLNSALQLWQHFCWYDLTGSLLQPW